MTTRLLLGALILSACATPPDTSPAAPASVVLRDAPYPCDGCEIADAADADSLGPTARLDGPGVSGERLVVEGVVLNADDLSPAGGVVLYAGQTGADGLYGSAEKGVEVQGWLRTQADGRYRIETIRPGPYPDGTLPAHIHIYVREPDREPYYVNDIVFESDPLVTAAYRASLLPGPDGVVTLERDADGWRATRDIILSR